MPIGDYFRKLFGGPIRKETDMHDTSHAERVIAHPPFDLLTDGGTGPSRRYRVDTGQTGFFAGRMFRSYVSAVIPVAGPPVSFRFTSPVDFILWTQALYLTQGALQLDIFTGDITPSGTWTQRPVIGVNRMASRPTPYYESVGTLEFGGSFTGGTLIDEIQLRSAAANTQASDVGQKGSERGLPAGVFYGRLSTLTGGVTVNDPAQVIYSLLWEERI